MLNSQSVLRNYVTLYALVEYEICFESFFFFIVLAPVLTLSGPFSVSLLNFGGIAEVYLGKNENTAS